MSPDQAQAVVEARLGRPAQDRLEAAVVLEAWGGLRAKEAIERGRRVVRRGLDPARGDHRGETRAKWRSGTVEGISLVLAVVAIAIWAAPLSAQLGAAWVTAVRVALPMTIALQALIWSRHLRGGVGPGTLRRESPTAIVALVALLAAMCTLGSGGATAALLISIWIGGTVLVSCGWILWYSVVLGLVSLALWSQAPSTAVLGLGAFTTLTGVVAALGRSAPVAASPGGWLRALGAGITGAWLGLLVVTDDTIGWGFRGALPALALIPSTVGGLWAGRQFSRLNGELTRALEGVPAWHADRVSTNRPGLNILAGSALRLVVATVVLSLACVVAGPPTAGTVSTSLFAAFGCLGLATLLVSLLVWLGLVIWAMFAVSVALLVEVTLVLPNTPTLPGGGLLAGSLAAAALMLPPIVMLFRRPGRALATAVWIN